MSQTAFAEALLRPDAPVPDGLVGPTGAAAGKRFNVYRNNVAVSLTEALEAGFPVVRKLVGPDFFKAMEGVFLRRHPPASPLMMHYGAEMPDFLAGFPPVAHLPYLADVARLELGLRTAYHAEDARPLAPDALAQVPAEALGAVRMGFAPAVRLVASTFPVHDIWLANTAAGAPPSGPGAQTALITRPKLDPCVDTLSPAAAGFVAALMAGASLGEAAETGADVGATLGLLLSRQAITDISS
ncbi:HvfC/BufC N-terminal domain-containing protein [Roseisalinus antarcticus]|uniref:Putative DNA-binding domain-containing protein n=1 Tax=Roseisalinus antarcticus TaxID=254357 RepID=A0A1Y5SU59_9RHOB|nr:DNA-binding domain-containing protein [Roseisalinus antarcticus]SLN48145.1 hypothetical protein ROA7023_02070 [Roseisalinus antarcticus]